MGFFSSFFSDSYIDSSENTEQALSSSEEVVYMISPDQYLEHTNYPSSDFPGDLEDDGTEVE